MKINADTVFMRVSRGLLVIPALTAMLATAPTRADQVRLYTNADLKTLDLDAKGGNAVTNADLKAPLPSQSKSLSRIEPDEADWQSVYDFIDRERAYLAKTREGELAYQRVLAENARIDREMQDRYSRSYYPWYPFFHFGRFAEFSVPSNPYASLRGREVRSAHDLFRESVRDSQIRRANLP